MAPPPRLPESQPTPPNPLHVQDPTQQPEHSNLVTHAREQVQIQWQRYLTSVRHRTDQSTGTLQSIATQIHSQQAQKQRIINNWTSSLPTPPLEGRPATEAPPQEIIRPGFFARCKAAIVSWVVNRYFRSSQTQLEQRLYEEWLRSSVFDAYKNVLLQEVKEVQRQLPLESLDTLKKQLVLALRSGPAISLVIQGQKLSYVPGGSDSPEESVNQIVERLQGAGHNETTIRAILQTLSTQFVDDSCFKSLQDNYTACKRDQPDIATWIQTPSPPHPYDAFRRPALMNGLQGEVVVTIPADLTQEITVQTQGTYDHLFSYPVGNQRIAIHPQATIRFLPHQIEASQLSFTQSIHFKAIGTAQEIQQKTSAAHLIDHPLIPDQMPHEIAETSHSKEQVRELIKLDLSRGYLLKYNNTYLIAWKDPHVEREKQALERLHLEAQQLKDQISAIEHDLQNAERERSVSGMLSREQITVLNTQQKKLADLQGKLTRLESRLTHREERLKEINRLRCSILHLSKKTQLNDLEAQELDLKKQRLDELLNPLKKMESAPSETMQTQAGTVDTPLYSQQAIAALVKTIESLEKKQPRSEEENTRLIQAHADLKTALNQDNPDTALDEDLITDLLEELFISHPQLFLKVGAFCHQEAHKKLFSAISDTLEHEQEGRFAIHAEMTQMGITTSGQHVIDIRYYPRQSPQEASIKTTFNGFIIRPNDEAQRDPKDVACLRIGAQLKLSEAQPSAHIDWQDLTWAGTGAEILHDATKKQQLGLL